MVTPGTHAWLVSSGQRARAFLQIQQPLTAKQLEARLRTSWRACVRILQLLRKRGLVRCLNEEASKSRLYWLTAGGDREQYTLARERGVKILPRPPDIDWVTYGWVCFTHRAAVITALTEALHPATIKRRARSRNPRLRMSANNVRDIIRLFRTRDIVIPVLYRREAHPRYELTPTGTTFQTLLQRAEVPA